MDLIEVLAAEYGISAPSLVPFYEDQDQAVYRVEHDGPPCVLRWFPPSRPLERVEGDAEVLRAIQGLDVKRLVETVDGRGSAHCGGRGVVVTRFIPGLLSPNDTGSLHRVAATLAAVGEVEMDSLPATVNRRAGLAPQGGPRGSRPLAG